MTDPSKSVISRYLCHRCQEDEGPCSCQEPCGSVNCLQFAGTCGEYPNGRRFHVWEPVPALTIEQITRWRVPNPEGTCVCGERTWPAVGGDR